jgi:hypothetical protein
MTPETIMCYDHDLFPESSCDQRLNCQCNIVGRRNLVEKRSALLLA